MPGKIKKPISMLLLLIMICGAAFTGTPLTAAAEGDPFPGGDQSLEWVGTIEDGAPQGGINDEALPVGDVRETLLDKDVGDSDNTQVLEGGSASAVITGELEIEEEIESVMAQAFDDTAGVMAGGYGSNGKFLAPIEPPDPNAMPIYTAQDLYNIRYNLAGSYIMMNDIDLSGFNDGEWVPIGSNENTFTGIFDGQGFEIFKLQVTLSNEIYTGLFGNIVHATIKNVAVEGTIHCFQGSSAGGVAGRAWGSSIINCVSDMVILSTSMAGGICGVLIDSVAPTRMGLIQDCIVLNTSEIRGVIAGGIVASARSDYDNIARIDNCRNEGIVSFDSTYDGGASSRHGGILGSAGRLVQMFNINNSGEISGAYISGGIVGSVGFKANVLIQNGINTGDVYGSTNCGGLIGSSDRGVIEISFSYNTGIIKSDYIAGGLIGYTSDEWASLHIDRSYNAGEVHSRYVVGGIVGFINFGTANIENCFNAGNIISMGGLAYHSSLAGGIVGVKNSGNGGGQGFIEYCYNIGTVSTVPFSGTSYAGGIIANYGNNSYTEHMRNNVTLSQSIDGISSAYIAPYTSIATSYNNLAADDITGAVNDADATYPRSAFTQQAIYEEIGWDFDTVWQMVPDYAYPQLQGLPSAGEGAIYTGEYYGILQDGVHWKYFALDFEYPQPEGMLGFLEIFVVPGHTDPRGYVDLSDALSLKPWLEAPYNLRDVDIMTLFINGTEDCAIIIPDNMFSGYKRLWSIDLNYVSGIGSEAFKDCNLSIVKVDGAYTQGAVNVIPYYGEEFLYSRLSIIGDKAFSGNPRLEEICLPDHLSIIGVDVFRGCDGLTIFCFGDSPIHVYAYLNDIKYSILNAYRVTFDLNGAPGTPPPFQMVMLGKLAIKPVDPLRSGYSFKGWYANRFCTGLDWFAFPLSNAISNNITLYAKWQKDFVTPDDLFSFGNNDDYFNSTYALSNEYFNILTSDLGYWKTRAIRKERDSKWVGSCHGMGVAEALFTVDKLTPGFFYKGAVNAKSIYTTPKQDTRIESLVNYYQLTQYLPTVSKAESASVKGKSQRDIIENLVTLARAAEDTGDFVSVIISRKMGDSRDGGHTLFAWKVTDESNGDYKVHLFESNDKTVTNSYFIVKSDYSNATFRCAWDWNGINISAGSLKITGLLNRADYDPKNLQTALTSRGYSVAPYNVAAFDVEPMLDIVTTNYSQFEASGDSGQSQINGDEYEGDLPLVDSATNESGTRHKYYFDNNSKYIIAPFSMLEDNYTTSVSFDDICFASATLSSNNQVEFNISGSVEVVDNDEIVDITLESTINGTTFPWETTTVTAKAYDLKIVPGADYVTVSSSQPLGQLIITANRGENIIVIPVDTNGKTIKISSKKEGDIDGIIVLDESNNEIVNAVPTYSVDFYTYGGSIVESVYGVEYGQTITSPADPTFEGYIFGGWYKDAECTDGEEWIFASDIVTGDTILHAKWIADENYIHCITFKADGYDDIIVLAADGDSLTEIPPVPEKPGLIGQWDTTDFSNILSDMTVYAIYTLDPSSPGSGDVSGDGRIDMQDVLLIYQYFRGKTDLHGAALAAADVDGDSAVDMADVLLVYQYFRGKITSFDL